MLTHERLKSTQEIKEGPFRERFGDELASYALALNRRRTPGSIGFVRVETRSEVKYVAEDKFHLRLAELLIAGINNDVSGYTPEEKALWLAELLSQSDELEPKRIYYADKPTAAT